MALRIMSERQLRAAVRLVDGWSAYRALLDAGYSESTARKFKGLLRGSAGLRQAIKEEQERRRVRMVPRPKRPFDKYSRRSVATAMQAYGSCTTNREARDIHRQERRGARVIGEPVRTPPERRRVRCSVCRRSKVLTDGVRVANDWKDEMPKGKEALTNVQRADVQDTSLAYREFVARDPECANNDHNAEQLSEYFGMRGVPFVHFNGAYVPLARSVEQWEEAYQWKLAMGSMQVNPSIADSQQRLEAQEKARKSVTGPPSEDELYEMPWTEFDKQARGFL